MDSWVMAGVLAITSMTTTLGMLRTMVNDNVHNGFHHNIPEKQGSMGNGKQLYNPLNRLRIGTDGQINTR